MTSSFVLFVIIILVIKGLLSLGLSKVLIGGYNRCIQQKGVLVICVRYSDSSGLIHVIKFLRSHYIRQII